MPELPEVEIVCEGLRKTILGAKITFVQNNRPNLRAPFPRNLKLIEGSKINSIERRAKYILINLSNGKTLIVHLGMSGKFNVFDKYVPEKHDHFLMKFSNKKIAVLNDARRFGLVDLADTAKLGEHALFNHLGPEPLEKGFNKKYLIEKLSGKKVAIKLAIMDQEVVVGVGNIYACESLYMAKIDPKRSCADISEVEVDLLVKSIKKILQAALKAGGSSIRDYVHTDGSLGYFQTKYNVYGKDGEKCKNCGTVIKKITQGGRSTFYCEKEQK